MEREVDSRCRRESEAAGSNNGELVSITWASRLQSSLTESGSTDYLSRPQFSESYDQLFDQDPFYKMCSTGDFWTWRYGDGPVGLPTTCTCRKFTQGYCYPLQWLLLFSKNMFTSLNTLLHGSKKVRYGIQRHNLRPAVDEAWSSHGSTYTWNRWEIEVHLWWEVWQPQWPSQALSFAVAQIAEESEMVLELCTWILPEIMVAWTIVEWNSSRRILE